MSSNHFDVGPTAGRPSDVMAKLESKHTRSHDSCDGRDCCCFRLSWPSLAWQVVCGRGGSAQTRYVDLLVSLSGGEGGRGAGDAGSASEFSNIDRDDLPRLQVCLVFSGSRGRRVVVRNRVVCTAFPPFCETTCSTVVVATADNVRNNLLIALSLTANPPSALHAVQQWTKKSATYSNLLWLLNRLR